MNTAKQLIYDRDEYLDEIFQNNKEEENLKREISRQEQSPIRRVISAAGIFLVLCIVLIPPSFLIYRYAETYGEQYQLYKMKVAINTYEVKANEIKERLELNTSLDDLSIYATEKLNMVKASNENVIIIEDNQVNINRPEVVFSLASKSGTSE